MIQGKLKNGLTYLLYDLPEYKSVTISLTIKVGSIYEMSKQKGISHLLEHMVFKGTKKYKNSQDLMFLLDLYGAQYNAMTMKHLTSYYSQSLCTTKIVKAIMDILCELVFFPKLYKSEFAKEKNVVLDELTNLQSNYGSMVYRITDYIMYENTEYAYPIGGFLEDIKNIKYKDMVNYWETFYCPENVYLTVSGKLPKNIKTIINNIFNKVPKKNNCINGYLDNICDKHLTLPMQTESKFINLKKQIASSYLQLSFPVCNNYNKDKYALDLLSIILGNGSSSRLFVELREKHGIVYMVSTGTGYYETVGNFSINIITDNININKSMSLIIDILVKLKGSITNKELRKAKEQMKSKLILGMEDTSQINNFLMNQLIFINKPSCVKEKEVFKINTLDRVVKIYNKVNINDIHNCIDKYIKLNRVNIGLIGEYNKELITICNKLLNTTE